MKNVTSLFKVFSINLVITLALISAVLLIPPIVHPVYLVISGFSETFNRAEDLRGELNLYSDFDWAKRHFQEFNALGTSYSDYVTWRRNDYIGDTINIANGVRSTYSDQKTAASSKEFWFFGGSSTWGTGVTDEMTYPSIFARTNGVKVINYGETEYIARQSLSRLQNIFVKTYGFEPNDLTIVFYSGVNDVVGRCRSEISELSTSREHQIRMILGGGSDPKWSFARTFGQLSDFLEAVSKRISSNEQQQKQVNKMFDCASDPKRAMEIAKTLIRTWESARDLAEANGYEFVGVLEPVAFIGSASYEYLSLNSYYDVALSEEYDSVYPLIREFAKKSAITFVDLTGVYDSCANCYIDFCHVGPQGNQHLSKALTVHLLAEAKPISK